MARGTRRTEDATVDGGGRAPPTHGLWARFKALIWWCVCFGVPLVAHLEAARELAPMMLDLDLVRARQVYLIATAVEVVLLALEFVFEHRRWAPWQRTVAGLAIVGLVMMQHPLVMLHENWLTLGLVLIGMALHLRVAPWLRQQAKQPRLAAVVNFVGRVWMAHFLHRALIVGLQAYHREGAVGVY